MIQHCSRTLGGVVLLLCVGVATSQSNRIWTLRIGYSTSRFTYEDEDGRITGVAIDILDAGLMSQWFDGCYGHINTIERSHVFAFSQPFLKAPDAYLYVLKGRTLNINSLQGKTIGFTPGAYTNKYCLKKYSTGFNGNPEKVRYYVTSSQVLAALRSGEIDGIFTLHYLWGAGTRDQVEEASGPWVCYIGGQAVMTRKDSAFPALFNVGLNKLKMTNKYSKLCNESNEKHQNLGRSLACID